MQLSYPYQRCALHRQFTSDGDCNNYPDLRYLCQKLEIPSVGGTVEPGPSSPLRQTARYKAIQAHRPLGCTYDYMLPESALEQFSMIASATTLASHALLILVTGIKTVSTARLARQSRMKAPLVTLLIRDGIVFLIIVIFNIFAQFYASPNDNAVVWVVWPYFYEVMNVIIVAHFLLDVRGLYPHPGETLHSGVPSSIMFNPRSPRLPRHMNEDDLHQNE
ncbi:hypothetical protein C8Q76DRAFT_641424 [Earliella scabrosa]|nr:hypothetical protein C8Q76DRAFT_641424 [Earliella scabrosa]